MKAIFKKNHHERTEESREKKDGEDVLQEQPCKKPKKKSFLAGLQNAWSKMVGRKARKTSTEEERSSSDLPGPSNIHPMDDPGKRAAIERFVEQVILQACHQIRVEQVVQEEHNQMCDQIYHMDDLHTQNGQNGELQNEKCQEAENEDLEKTDKPKKKRKIKFLARLQKSWARIASRNRRGYHILQEESSCETSAPNNISTEDSKDKVSSKVEKKEGDEGEHNTVDTSEEMMEDCRPVKDFRGSLHLKTPEEPSRSTTYQSKRCHKEQSTKFDISSEQPGTSKETSFGTVPLSLECFKLHHALGQGSFGRVFLATDVIRRERVAIKVSDKRDYTELGISLVERDVLQLSHESPYLIKGLAAFHTLKFVYYVMEVATGGNLVDFILKYWPLDTATVKFLTAELVCGTEFLHRKGIIHRDLKPHNILLTREGHIKIADFGIAVTGVFERTKDACQGTPGYAAPEMVNNQPHGRGVDYFAIGVILYNLLTKSDAFPGASVTAVRRAVVLLIPRYPKSLTPDTVNILEGLLCKDQFQRLGVKGDIRKHPFFSGLSWEDVEAQRMPSPVAILVTGSVDLNTNETLDYTEPPQKIITIRSKHQKVNFSQFSFVCPEWSTHYHPLII